MTTARSTNRGTTTSGGGGPNKDGQNMLGKLWMRVRQEIRKANHVAE